MTGTIHVFDLLEKPPFDLHGGLCPIFGNDRFLKRLALKQLIPVNQDNDFSASYLDGAIAQWADVLDELSTRSLFGSAQTKTVVVDNGDAFVKQYRDKLEKYLDQVSADGSLILLVDSWPTNTRLYKRCDKSFLQIDCSAPVNKRGRKKDVDEARIMQWLMRRAQQEYGFELPAVGAPILTELTETDFGRMDQELAKLSLYACEESLDPASIREIVGGWPAQTMWQAIDAATDGDAGTAIELLNQLLQGGEHPLALLGQLAWSLRRYAEVGEITRRDKWQGNRIDLKQAIRDAGFRSWNNEMENADRRLKQLGRDRVNRINDWLLEADLALKRSHSQSDRGRLVLEKLVTKMARELAPAQPAQR